MADNVAELLIGPQYPAEVKWGCKVEHCPDPQNELGKCVGKFVIYAYLQVTEERSTVLSWLPFVDPDYYEWKILPMKFEEVFKIDCLNAFQQTLHGQKFAADHCAKSCETPAPNPKSVGDSQFQYAVPASITDPDPPDTPGTQVKSKTTLTWQQGTVLAGFPPGAGGSVDVLGLGSVTLGASGGQVTSGPVHTITIDWTVTWDAGICTIATTTPPTTSYDDAKRVFEARESVREL
jgi:hypothetical protein